MEQQLRLALAEMQKLNKESPYDAIQVKVCRIIDSVPFLEGEYGRDRKYYFRAPGVDIRMCGLIISNSFHGVSEIPDARDLLEYAKCAHVTNFYIELIITKLF